MVRGGLENLNQRLSLILAYGSLNEKDRSYKKIEKKTHGGARVYCKNLNEAHLLDKYDTEHDLPEHPIAISHADACRLDLPFEIELDAVKAS